jgi:cytochrome b561
MLIRDSAAGYGLVSRLFHWLMALAIFGMFGLGLWMTGLDYYSPYYHSAPELHKGIGILILVALVVRFLWRQLNVRPADDDLAPWERVVSRGVHRGFYLLLAALMVSGYLISTADGRPIDVFGWFKVPSLIEHKGMEDPAGLVHEILAYTVIALAVLHALGALKHHVLDRGSTLTRMWSGPPTS